MATALGLVGVDREGVVVATARVGDEVLAAAQRALHPGVDEVEGQRCVGRNAGVQRRRRVPGLVAHAGHELAGDARGLQRQHLAVDGDDVAAFVQAGHAHLDALQRRVDIAHRAAGRAFLAHHVPRFERVAQRQLHAHRLHLAHEREAELEVRREPVGIEGKAGLAHLADDVVEVHLDEGRQQEAVVQLGAPAGDGRLVGRVPEAGDQRADQQLLRDAHARMRRHLEGAQFQQAEAAGAGVGRVELVDAELAAVRVARHVDQDVAQRAVDQPRGHVLAVDLAVLGDFLQRNFELVDLVVARFVHARRLAGRADEHAREQVAQRRVVVPVQQQAGQQLGPAQERAVGGRGAAHHEVVAAAGAGVAAVGHELLGRQARLERGVVEELGVVDQFLPVVGRVDVDFDHARVGRHGQHLQARIARRRIAFHHDAHAQLLRGGFDGGDEVEVVLQARQRRHEDVEHARGAAFLLGRGAVGAARVAHLDAQRGARDPVGRFAAQRLARGGRGGIGSSCRIALRRIAGALHAQRRGHHGRRAEGVGHLAQVGAGHRGGGGIARAVVGRAGQRGARRGRVALDEVGVVALAGPRLRVERQAVAHGRIARDQEQAVVAQEPGAGLPAGAGERGRVAVGVAGLDGQHVADHRVELLREHAAQAHAFEFVVELGVEGVDVHRQAAFAPQVVVGVLVAGLDVALGEAQLVRQHGGEAARVLARVVRGKALVGEQLGVVPQRLAVGAPEDRQRPARQLLARVPLALAEMQEAALAVLGAQLVHELGGVAALGGAERVGVPFGRVAVAGGHVGGLTAHREAHVAGHEARIDRVAEREHLGPLFFGVGLGDARRFVDARDLHLVAEFDLGLVDAAFDGRGARRRGRAGQRDVAFAGEQARGGVQADPAGARQEHLAPGVQVGEVDRGAAGAVERLHVGRELDQVARHEARGQAAVAQQLHQQPARVAARAAAVAERFFRRLHAGLHADEVADVLLHLLVDADQEVDGALFLALDPVEVGLQQRRGLLGDEVGRQLFGLRGRVLEGEVLGLRLEEEVEGVVDRHLDHEVDRDLELARLLGEHEPRLVVGERVLHPVDEVLGRLDPQRVRDHIAAAMGRGAQSHDLRAQLHQAVVCVVGDVVECGVDGHA
ncbi:hypothetical protein D9M72_263100 [compost metagenome]